MAKSDTCVVAAMVITSNRGWVWYTAPFLATYRYLKDTGASSSCVSVGLKIMQGQEKNMAVNSSSPSIKREGEIWAKHAGKILY